MFGGENNKFRSRLLNFFFLAGFICYLLFQDFGVLADMALSTTTKHNISETLDLLLFLENNQQNLALLDLDVGTEFHRNVSEQKEIPFYYYESPDNSRGGRASYSKKSENNSSHQSYPNRYRRFEEDDDDDDTKETNPHKWENLDLQTKILIVGFCIVGGYILACSVSVALDYVFGPGTGLNSSARGAGKGRRR
jgi:hypothetical protein